MDGITSTKVANWDKVYEDWNDVFTINSNGDLQVKVNVIGEKDVSAYGSGSSSSSGAITIVDNLTSTATTAALSANQGRVLKNLIDNIDVGNIDVDLSDYYTKSEVNNSFASSNHNHSVATTSASGFMSASDKSKLDGITASADSVSFSRSLTAGTKVGTITINGTATDLYCEKNTDTNTTYSVVGANGSTGLVKNGSSVTNASGYIACPIVGGVPYYKDTNTTYSLSSFGITATAAELNYCDGVTSNIQTQLNSKSASGHSHNYAGSSSAGGAATSANKVNSTLSWSGYNTGSFNGSGAASFTIPSNTNQLTNGAGYITTAATVANADKLDGYHGSSANTANNYVLRGSSGQINVGAINASGDTNIVGNLTVTGEITAYADGGNATPFIYNATSYSSINSTATNQVPTVNVVTLIKNELEATKTRLDTAETKLNKIKTYLNSLTSSSTLANVLTALINIKNNI